MCLNTLKQGPFEVQTRARAQIMVFSIHSACLHVTMITVNSSSPSAPSAHTFLNSLSLRHPNGPFTALKTS